MDDRLYVTYLRDLEVAASIGIHEAERQARQRLLISVVLFQERAPELSGETADAIGSVVDYDFVRDACRSLVAETHFELQETLCLAILEACLGEERVRGAVVRTEKPDVYADAAGVGCKVARFKDATLQNTPWWLIDV